jgi:inorganic phosphate transporter, PiT family
LAVIAALPHGLIPKLDGRSTRKMLMVLVAMTLFVAYSNGANDNFKGVATLYGSNTTTFKTALWIGTIATFAGCISSVFLADGLVKAFSGKGLVPDAVSASPNFLLAVAAGAASTVMLATVFSFPISTTHALTGALVGAGFMAAGPQLDLGRLGSAFFLPLLMSPLISILLTMPLYKLAHTATRRLGISKDTCVCVGPGALQLAPSNRLTFDAGSGIAVTVDSTANCRQSYNGQILGFTAQGVVDGAHYLSGAAVSFARGLNDTPKIVGLLLVVKALDVHVSMLAIALVMATGGLLNARGVAETMAKKISTMNDGQALTANLVTAFMVIVASRAGVPVSTTHVSVGAITGVGLINGTADKGVIGSIVLSWLLTLPIAAATAALAYWLTNAAG